LEVEFGERNGYWNMSRNMFSVLYSKYLE